MANKYDTVSIPISMDDKIRITGHYEFIYRGVLYNKSIKLTYRLLEVPESSQFSMEKFMVEYMNRTLLEGFLNVQSGAVYWRKFIIKTPTTTFTYHLPDNIRGLLEKPPKGDSVYQFNVQMGENRVVVLQVYGVPSKVSPLDIEKCENALLDPINMKGANMSIIFCGIHTQSDIFNIVGRGLRDIPQRKSSKVKAKLSKKNPVRAK